MNESPGDVEHGELAAARQLRCLGMPAAEIAAVLETDRPDVVRMHVELFKELLRERLADRERELDELERLLIVDIRDPSKLRGPDSLRVLACVRSS